MPKKKKMIKGKEKHRESGKQVAANQLKSIKLFVLNMTASL